MPMVSLANPTLPLRDEELLKQWANLYDLKIGGSQKAALLKRAQKILQSERELKRILAIDNPLDPIGQPLSIAFLELIQRLHLAHPTQQLLGRMKKYWIPIAANFGMWKIRFLLEDWLFKVTDPQNYELILSLLKTKNRIHQELFQNIIDIVAHQVKKEGITPHTILWRKKNTFGIYEKMRRKQQNINHINDLFAIRIILNTTPECYKALDTLHYLWPPYLDRLKDYIKNPKANGYRSLHTVLYCLDGQIVEFQIRTQKMDFVAKFGPASHALYKKTARRLRPSFDDKSQPFSTIN